MNLRILVRPQIFKRLLSDSTGSTATPPRLPSPLAGAAKWEIWTVGISIIGVALGGVGVLYQEVITL